VLDGFDLRIEADLARQKWQCLLALLENTGAASNLRYTPPRATTLSCVMPRYYFDTQTNGQVIPDREGLDLPGEDAARREAGKALADMAKDVLPTSSPRQLSVEVRDEEKLLLVARLMFQIARAKDN
jgi:hypothetical protein